MDDTLEDTIDDGLPAHGYFKPLNEQDTECKHHFWIKRCSMCSMIMESDSQCNVHPGDSMRISYGPLDTLVCTLKLGQQLKDVGVYQKSKLYWVIFGESKLVSLRTCEDSCKVKNTEAYSAFTSQELCKHILRLPRKMLTPAVFQLMGRNAHDPNRLARLLLKKLRNI